MPDNRMSIYGHRHSHNWLDTILDIVNLQSSSKDKSAHECIWCHAQYLVEEVPGLDNLRLPLSPLITYQLHYSSTIQTDEWISRLWENTIRVGKLT